MKTPYSQPTWQQDCRGHCSARPHQPKANWGIPRAAAPVNILKVTFTRNVAEQTKCTTWIKVTLRRCRFLRTNAFCFPAYEKSWASIQPSFHRFSPIFQVTEQHTHPKNQAEKNIYKHLPLHTIVCCCPVLSTLNPCHQYFSLFTSTCTWCHPTVVSMGKLTVPWLPTHFHFSNSGKEKR